EVVSNFRGEINDDDSDDENGEISGESCIWYTSSIDCPAGATYDFSGTCDDGVCTATDCCSAGDICADYTGDCGIYNRAPDD
ncbi:unnamed protein product, partial [Ectocarpus fasciculatus]